MQKAAEKKGTRRKALVDVDNLPELSFGTYCKFLFIVFMISGFMLLFYCLLTDVNPFVVDTMSCPFLYMGLGFICMICFIVDKIGNKSYPKG